MSKITITKENAEFIKKTATKEINTGKNWQRTFFVPVFYALTDVVVDCNVVTGKHRQTGDMVEYEVEFTEEAEEILDIY